MTRRKTISAGRRFGHLVVIGVGIPNGVRSTSIVKCDCGKTATVENVALLNYGRISCGCAQGSNFRTHGQSKTRVFKIWANMIQRCYTDRPIYKHYFVKDIRVCDEWKNSFEKFREWALSHGYSDNLSIDRIDPNGNYEPSNCRWIAMSAQQRNKRNNRKILVDGLNLCVSEWADRLGVSKQAMYQAIHRGEDPVKYVMKILSK